MKTEIQKIVEDLANNSILYVDDIPNIDLYVDQLIGFIEDNVYNNNENHLTKSMVNNYSKNKVIPGTTKKKYTLPHIVLLVIVYNTKSIISMKDITKLLTDIDEAEILEYYNKTNELMELSNNTMLDEILEDYNNLEEAFKNDNKKIARVLATKLAIEANYKKILSELIIEKYL